MEPIETEGNEIYNNHRIWYNEHFQLRKLVPFFRYVQNALCLNVGINDNLRVYTNIDDTKIVVLLSFHRLEMNQWGETLGENWDALEGRGLFWGVPIVGPNYHTFYMVIDRQTKRVRMER